MKTIMKTLKTVLLVVTLLIGTISFSQTTTYTFDVISLTNLSNPTQADADAQFDTIYVVEGDTIEFVNMTQSTSTFEVNKNGFVDLTTPLTINGNLIWSHIVTLNDLISPTTYTVLDPLNGYAKKEIRLLKDISTGVNDFMSEDVEFSVYPNPTTDFLNISTTDNIESVKVYDMNGRLVILENHNTSSVRLDVKSLKNGYYTVIINDVKPVKFIKR